jgi:L-lactate dehydrogenase
VRAVRDDERVVLTLSTPIAKFGTVSDVCFSLPRVLGANGVEATLLPTLSEEETIALENSARILREAAGATL